MSLFSIKQGGGGPVQDWTATLSIGKGVFDYHDSQGDVTINANLAITSVLDGPMIVRRYNNLVLDAATQNVTVYAQHRCRGWLLLIDGNLTLQRSSSWSASLSMSGRGCRGSNMMGNHDVLIPDSITLAGKKILQRDALALLKSQGFAIIDRWLWDEWGKYLGVSATAWTGGTVLLSAASCGNNPQACAGGTGTTGGAGSNGGTGGGGGGGTPSTVSSDRNVAGCPWSGGPGGSGNTNDVAGVSGPEPFGGRGGRPGNSGYGGGAGNPSGNNVGGSSGTGGVLIIVCKGNVNVGAGCFIQANGAPGENATTAGGGGSGGGHVSIVYGGTYTNNGTVMASGGAGGTGTNAGGSGGAGSVVTKTFAQMGWS